MGLTVIINNETLDLSPGESILFSKSGARIGEISTRNGSLTNDFTIPLSTHNIRLLGYTDKNTFTSRLPYKKQEAELHIDAGLPISYGFIQLVSYNLAANTATITFYGDFSGFSSLLEGKSIRELDLSEYNHRYTVSNIIESFFNTEGYIYPLVNYGRMDNYSTLPNTVVTDWFPGTFQITIVKKIAEEAGYKISGPLLSEWEYNRTVIPFSNENFQVSESYAANFTGSALSTNNLYTFQTQNVIGTGGSESQIVFQSVVQDSFESFNASTGLYTCPEGNTYKGKFSIDTVDPASVVINGNGSVTVRVQVFKNDTDILLNEQILFADSSDTNFIAPRTVVYEINDELNAGDTIGAKVVYEYNATSTSSFIFAVHTANAILEISAIDRIINQGDVVTLSSNLPEISQEEFIQDVFQRYAVLPYVDESNKTIFLYPFEYIVNRLDLAKDWSSKIIHNGKKEVKLTDLVQNYAQKNYFNYAENTEDDEQLEAYRKENLYTFGRGSLTINNEFIPGEKDEYESPFAPTLHKDAFSGIAYLPYIPRYQLGSEEILQAKPRILICTSPVNMATGLTKGFFGNTTSINIDGINTAVVPYAFFQRKQIGADSDKIVENLSWGIPNILNPIGKGILERRYGSLKRILDSPKVLEISVKLWPHEVAREDFLTPIYINTNDINGYFILDSIEDYSGKGIALAKFTEIPSQSVGVDEGGIADLFIVPGSISDLSASISSQQITLNWSSPSGSPTGYKVFYKASTDSVFIEDQEVEVVTTATITGLTNGTQYDFYVVPVNSEGDGEPSNTISTTPSGVPDAISDLQASVFSERIELSWTAPNGNGIAPSSYEVFYKLSTESVYISDGITESTSDNITNLTNGSSYDFKVQALNLAGSSADSNVVTAIPSTVPGQITDVSLSPSNAQIEISFTPPDSGGVAITRYDLLIDSTTTVSNISSPYTLAGLTNGQEYALQVAAVNSNGSGTYSNVVRATPESTGASWGLVVSNTSNPNAWEASLKAALETAGSTAAYIDDASTSISSYDIIYILPSASESDLNTSTFKATSKPVILGNPNFAQELGLSGSAEGGYQTNNAVDILVDGNALAAGFTVSSGEIDISSSNYGIGYLAKSTTSSGVANIALFVANTSLSVRDDQALFDYLSITLGHSVTVFAHDDPAPSAASYDMSVVGESVSSGIFAGKLDAWASNVIFMERAISSQHRISDDSFSNSNGTQIEINNSSHPLAAGLSGTVTIFNTSSEYFFQQTSDLRAGQYTSIANVPGTASNEIIILIESGQELFNGNTAPAGRIYSFMGQDSFSELTADGLALFQAQVDYFSPSGSTQSNLGGTVIADVESDSNQAAIVSWNTGESLEDATTAAGPRIFWGLLGNDAEGNNAAYNSFESALIGQAVSLSGLNTGGTVGLPSGLQQIKIGTFGSGESTASYNSSTQEFTLTSDGQRINNTSDGFLYVYEQISGNKQIDLRINTLVAPDEFAKAGIMVRSDLSDDSQMFGVYVTPDDSAEENRITYRSQEGDLSVNINGLLSHSSNGDTWLRILVNGNQLTAQESTDGNTYNSIGSVNIAIPTNYYVGIALSSNDTADLATSVVSEYAVQEIQSVSPGGSFVNVFGSSVPVLREPITYGYGMVECGKLWGRGLSMNYVFPTTMQEVYQALESPQNNIIVPLCGGSYNDTGDFRVSTNKAFLGWLAPSLCQIRVKGGGTTDTNGNDGERIFLSHLRIEGKPQTNPPDEVDCFEILRGIAILLDHVDGANWTDGCFDISTGATADITYRHCCIFPGMDGERSRETPPQSDLLYHPENTAHNNAIVTYAGSRLTMDRCFSYLARNRLPFCRLDELEKIGCYDAHFTEKTAEITTSNASGEHIIAFNVTATGPWSKSGAKNRAPNVYKAKSSHRIYVESNLHQDDRGNFNYSGATAFDAFQETVPSAERWVSWPTSRDSGSDQIDFSQILPADFSQRVAYITSQAGAFFWNRTSIDQAWINEGIALNRQNGYHFPVEASVASTTQTIQDLIDKGMPATDAARDEIQSNGRTAFENWALDQKDILEGRAS